MAKIDPANLPTLGDFEGTPVKMVGIGISNAGDGLTPALAIAPVLIRKRDRVFVLLECECTDVRHPSIDENGEYCMRKQILHTTMATIVDAEVAEPLIAAQKERNLEAQLAKEKAQGVQHTVEADGTVPDFRGTETK